MDNESDKHLLRYVCGTIVASLNELTLASNILMKVGLLINACIFLFDIYSKSKGPREGR